MTPVQVKWLMIAIIIAFYLFDTFLELLNLRHHTTDIPEEVRDVYDSEKYAQSQRYKKANIVFSLVTSTFTTLLTVLMLAFDGFAYIDSLARSITDNPLLVSLLFFAIIYYGLDILTLPFQIYDTFVIEEKFGFNRTTVKVFITDKLKSWLLTAIIGGALLAAIAWIYLRFEDNFWILALAVIAVFQVFFSMFYADLIVPLFNKLSPLPEGELRDRLEEFARKAGYTLKDVYQIDSSKRSTKLNAYFTGLGPKKKIVLFDTLIEKLSADEIVAVLAHEVGHYKHKHIAISTLVSLAITGLYLYLFQMLSYSQVLAQAMGVQQPSFHIALLALSILYAPIDFVIGMVSKVISRKFEWQADEFAKQNADADMLVSALKKLTAENLSNLTPHPWYVFFHYSHPTLVERIKHLKS